MKYKKDLVLIFFFVITFSTNAQILTVEITNIRNNKGNIALAVFTDNKSFQAEEPYIDKNYPKENIKNGKLTIKIKINPGHYGISILDDENNDGKMEYSFIRLPKEGYGFSNYCHIGLRHPNFEDFDFIVGEKGVFVQVKMKYF